MLAIIENHQSCIKLSPSGMDERFDEMAKPHTLVHHRTFTHLIVKQTNAIAVGGVYFTQIEPFLRLASFDDFCLFSQSSSTEKMLQVFTPFC